jgi:hypothetical protein
VTSVTQVTLFQNLESAHELNPVGWVEAIIRSSSVYAQLLRTGRSRSRERISGEMELRSRVSPGIRKGFFCGPSQLIEV